MISIQVRLVCSGIRTDLKHLATGRLVSIVAQVSPVVWGGRSKAEHMTEDPDNPE